MSSSPPATPLSKSRWGRMGGVVRRASTLMAISRPGTPSERDSDTASLRRSTSRELIPPAVPALSPPPPPRAVEASLPTPIAESPVREAEATQQQTVGPSPLAQPSVEDAPPAQAQEEVLTASPEPIQPSAAPLTTTGDQGEQASSPTGYIPPPVIDSLAGNPGAFTDDPESLPQPDVLADPYSSPPPPLAEVPASTQAPAAPAQEEAQVTDAESAPPAVVDSSAGNPGAFTDLSDNLPKPVTVVEDPFNSTPNPISEPPPAAAAPTESAPETNPAPQEDAPLAAPAPVEEKHESYFDRPIVESVFELEAISSEVPPAVAAAVVSEPAPAPEAAPAASEPEPAPGVVEAAPVQLEEPPVQSQPQPQDAAVDGEAASYMRGDVSMPVPETHMNDARPVQDPPASPQAQLQPQTGSSFGAAVMPSYGHDMDMSMGLPSYSGHDIWGGAISTNTGASNTATAAEYKQKTNSNNANVTSTSQAPAEPERSGGHDVWATGTIVAGAAAAAAAAAIGGMAYVASQSHHEEEQKAYTSAVPMPVPNPATGTGIGDAGASLSRESSMRMPLPNPHPEPSEELHDHETAPYPDPFADPVPSIAIQDHDGPQSGPQMPQPAHEEAQPIVVPLPPFHEVIPSGSIHRVPSHSSSYSAGNGNVNLQTDERIPLLTRPETPSRHPKHGHNNPYTTQAPAGKDHSSISPLLASGSASGWNPNSHSSSHQHSHSHHARANGTHQLRLHELGWLEYHLPDGTVYYVHPTRKVTTDVNLRKEVVLNALEAWLDERIGSDGEQIVNVGVEGWVREVLPGKGGRKAAKGKKGETVVFFERHWVDHIARTVIKEDEAAERRVGGYGRGNGYSYQYGHMSAGGKGKKQASGAVLASGSGKKPIEEDQLDLEYRFWSFVEAYPAHSALPVKARTEAMDVLTWAWTDRLLPSNRAIPSPFSQEECQELMALLRSFNENRQDDYGIQTRVIARILLRVAQWRQMYFRPNKPLPKDVSAGPTHRLPTHRRPLSRAFFDFFVSILCLGIPYLFLERARFASSVDEESGLLRSASPMVVIGACTCLVAAIVLSASVTFLSLPGLDTVARTAGMVAVLFAAFTMVATGVAVLRQKMDLERRVPHIGVEGLMVVSRRSVALSLPLVFLAYSIIAFVTGIVLYSYRGVSSTDPTSPKHPFEDYMHWTVVGVVGGLAGIVTTSLLLFRR